MRQQIRVSIACLLALCATLVCSVGNTLAGPAYRKAVTSNSATDSWRDGLYINILTDEARCKKSYGDRWAAECSAPPAGREGKEVEGIVMTPSAPGVWRWSSSGTMQFEPAKPLAPNTTYAISLEKVQLPARFDLPRKLTYKTQPQAVLVGQETLWIDPSAKKGHVLSVPLSFVWPVDRESMSQRIRLEAMGNNGLEFGEPQLVWNEDNDSLVVNAKIVSLPVQNVAAQITVEGLPAFAWNNGRRVITSPQARSTQARMQVTGTGELMTIQDITVQSSYNDGLAREYTLEITTNLQTKPADVLKHLDLMLLPRKSGASASVDANWEAMPAISAADIGASTKLQATLLQPADEPATRIRLRANMEAGRYLMAAVSTGLPSTSGLTLNKVRRFIRKVPGMQPEINFLQPGNVLAFGQGQRVDIHSVGVNRLKWRLEKVREPFLALLAAQSGFVNPQDGDTNLDSMTVAREGELNLPTVKAGAPAFTALDLTTMTPEKQDAHGLLRLVLTGYDKDNRQCCESSRLILFTDLGLMFKEGANGNATAFVRSLAGGKPVSGAEVRILGSNGQPVLTAKTDSDGRADLPSTRGLAREKRPVAVIAVSGSDLAWLSLSEASRQVDYSNFAVSGQHGTAEGLSASLFTQRGLYLPGETLHFGCIVRRDDWQPFTADIPLVAELTDPTGNRVLRREFTVGKDGMASFDWKSPDTAPTGTYQLDVLLAGNKKAGRQQERVVLGTLSTRVEEFQPDTLSLRVNMEPAKARGWIRTAPGDTATAVAQLDNLYGDPAVGHRIRARLALTPGQLRFAGYEDFTFCDTSVSQGEGQTINLPDAFTDKDGKATLGLPLEALRVGTSFGTLYMEGQDLAGGRAVTRNLASMFSPRAFVLGYKPEAGANNLDYVAQNAGAALKLLAVDNTLTPKALSGLKVTFSARRYVNSLVSDSRGAYHYEASPVDTELLSREMALDARGTSLPLLTDTAGDFLVTIRDSDGQNIASIPYSVAGLRLASPETLSQDMLRHGSLRLKLEKDNYAAGDTINCSISTPFDGTGLITIERERVVAHAWFTAKAGESVQQIKIPSDFEGRGYVNVSFVRDQASQAIYINPHAFAVVPFTAGLNKRDMGLSLSVPEAVKPGQKVTVKVNARVPGRVQLFAVDEGVLQLTSFATPNPLTDLLTNRALDVTTRQAFDLLMPDHERLRGRIPGFGGGMGNGGGRFLNPFRRKNEPPLAFWSAITDVDGSGEVSFTVPEYFAGQVRIMAVGSASSGDVLACGNAKASTKVRGTLVLKPQLPLAVAPGDTFEAALVVGNTIEGSGAKLPVAISMKLPAGLELLNGQKEHKLEIDENTEKAFTFTLKATEQLGEATVAFAATAPKVEGEVTRSQSLSIRPAGQRLRREMARPLLAEGNGQGGEIVLDTGRDLYPFEAKTSLTLSGGPLLALRSAFDQLEDYPYGCTEQLISRAMPHVALWNAPAVRKQVMQKRSEEAQRQRGNELIAAAIAAIRASQNWEGVAAWPNADHDNLFLTAYAADFLVMLRENGLAVPDDVAGQVLDSLERAVNRTPRTAADARYRAYGIWVLLRDGRIMTSALTELEKWIKANLNKWENDVMAALMADSFAALRMRRHGEALLPPATLQVTTDERLSTGMARSLYALIMQKTFAGKEMKITEQLLLDSAFDQYATTVDRAMTIRALVGMVKDAAPDSAAIAMRCEAYAPGVDSNSQAQQVLEDGMLTLDAPACRRFAVNVQGQAGNGLYALLGSEGHDRGIPAKTANGLEVRRIYKNSDGDAVTTAKLGDVLTVNVCARATGESLNNAVLVDLLPGGLEAELEVDGSAGPQAGLVRRERREDRSIFFVNLATTERCYAYKARAATRGVFTLPAVQAEGMYQPAKNAVQAGGTLEVK